MTRVLRSLIWLCVFPAPVLAEDAARATSSSVEVPAEAAPGMVVHLDDKGRPVVPPRGARVPVTSAVIPEPRQGPPEILPAPGGGQMIILRGDAKKR